MARSGPEKPVVSLEGQRERTISRLGELFANDAITLDELERRIEQAYRASDVAMLERLTSDVPQRELRNELMPAASAHVPDLYVPLQDRILSIMSETKRQGVWQLPQRLEVVSIMSNTHLDLTSVALPSGVTVIEVTAVMASVRVTVPRHVRVVVQPGTMMATIVDRTEDPPPVGSGAPVLRITGFIFMAELKVKPPR